MGFFISDRVQRKNALTFIYAVRGLGFLALLVMPGTVGLWVFAVIAGSSWLATVPQTSALAAEVYGVRNVGLHHRDADDGAHVRRGRCRSCGLVSPLITSAPTTACVGGVRWAMLAGAVVHGLAGARARGLGPLRADAASRSVGEGARGGHSRASFGADATRSCWSGSPTRWTPSWGWVLW